MTGHELSLLMGHNGYLGLFFCLWLGIIGMPIPDEVVVMTGGMVTSIGVMKPIPAFIVTYLGVVSGLTLGYTVGRILGVNVIDRLKSKPKVASYLPNWKSCELMNNCRKKTRMY